jgi:hypothetical protein|tara:strand:+ start:95 stop:493 length:399 start_codon:yes stop_codon:yes gene_type:complete
MINTIKYISYLAGDERMKSFPDTQGMFKPSLRKMARLSGWKLDRIRKQKSMFSMSFVQHQAVRTGDPVINLENGEKIRVYLSGDPERMLTESRSLLELHDKKHSSVTSAPLQEKRHIDDDEIYSLMEELDKW